MLTLENLIKQHRTLADLFLPGLRAANPFKPIKVQKEEKPFKGKPYPTFFKFRDKAYRTELYRQCPSNSRSRIAFETEFQNAYRQARREAFSQSIARLQQGTSAAATTLLKVMIDPNASASVRVRAADSVLNHASKAIEIEDIEARLSELERATEASRQMTKS